MKNIKWMMLAVAMLLTLTAVACQSSAPDAQEWGSAPDFSVMNAEGETVQLSDFAGKPVVINFWATWCGYCKMEMPDFDKAYREYPDVVFLMINATDGVYETKEMADAYVKSEGFSFDVYYDVASAAQIAYKVSGFPTTVFINAQGDVVAKEVGMISYETLIGGIARITE